MRYITLDNNNVIISVRFGNEIVGSEIESEIGEVGQLMQADGTFIEQSKTLDDVKKEKYVELQQAYYSSFTTFQSDALGTLKTYPIDAEAQKNFNDYQNRLIADANKDSFYFKTLDDNTLIKHTRVQFLQLLEDAEMFKVNQTIKVNELVNQVIACTTKEEIEAIIW